MEALLNSLETWREDRGYSKAYIAGALGVTPQAYGQWFGKGKVPAGKRKLVRDLLSPNSNATAFADALHLLPEAVLLDILKARAPLLSAVTRLHIIRVLTEGIDDLEG